MELRLPSVVGDFFTSLDATYQSRRSSLEGVVGQGHRGSLTEFLNGNLGRWSGTPRRLARGPVTIQRATRRDANDEEEQLTDGCPGRE